MAITRYLAMTAAEMRNISQFPEKIAWMACHFSPYSTGISNLPQTLPAGSLLILNDIIPFHGHDPQRIAHQLADCLERHNCAGVLLDFQRGNTPELEDLAAHLGKELPFPVAYPASQSGPVFVPIPPCSVPLQEYVAPWKGRDIWLEVGLSGQRLRLTTQGCEIEVLSYLDIPPQGHIEQTLHCHYHIRCLEDEIHFLLWRTRDDLNDLLEEAERLGVQTVVGLWQEIG